MAYHVTHRLGHMDQLPPSAFPELLRELDANPDDEEHGSVSVTHESEWCLSVSRGGNVTFENLEEGEPRHMRDVAPDRIIALWNLLADGSLTSLESEPWQPGYC